MRLKRLIPYAPLRGIPLRVGVGADSLHTQFCESFDAVAFKHIGSMLNEVVSSLLSRFHRASTRLTHFFRRSTGRKESWKTAAYAFARASTRAWTR
jgi:4-hydroxy-3-methylbut-2-en-1-yl diphosphate synthase IspG/GcpE